MLAIYSLSPNKAPGPDMIPNSVLMSLPCETLIVMLEYFNRFYENGTLPNSFSEIEMVMVHKKGDTSLPENYRGIALVNTCT